MSLFSRFFYKRPPDGLLEFIERVYVFDSCFSTEVLPDGIYRIYLQEIVMSLHEEFPDSSFLAFNFREGEKRSHFAEVLSEYDVVILDYPRQYEGCPLLPLSLIQHLLRVCENWLLLENEQNIILFHCERGGWPLLAFLLASLLIFKKIQTGEQRTLDMVYREAPKGLLHLLSPLNPFPSQLRYLQYVARRDISTEWPPMERSLSLDCVILRAIPNFDSNNGCRPVIQIFGRNFNSMDGISTKMLYSMSQKKRSLRHYKQADSDVIKIDIQCLVQGDTVLECVHHDMESERDIMMFRIMFNTAFIRSNILILNSDDLDILWDSRNRFSRNFRAEVLFGDTQSISLHRAPTTTLNGEEKGGLPIEAFSRVQELFGGVEWLDSSDTAALRLLKQVSVNALQEVSVKIEKLILTDVKELARIQSNMSDQLSVTSSTNTDEENYESDAVTTEASIEDVKNNDGIEIDSFSEYGHQAVENDLTRITDDIANALSIPSDEVKSANDARSTNSVQIPSHVSTITADSEVAPMIPSVDSMPNNGMCLLKNSTPPPPPLPPPFFSHTFSLPDVSRASPECKASENACPLSACSSSTPPPPSPSQPLPLLSPCTPSQPPPPPPPPPRPPPRMPPLSTSEDPSAQPTGNLAQPPRPPPPPLPTNSSKVLNPPTPPLCRPPANKHLPPPPPPPPPISSNVVCTTSISSQLSMSNDVHDSLNPTLVSTPLPLPPPPPPPPPQISSSARYPPFHNKSSLAPSLIQTSFTIEEVNFAPVTSLSPTAPPPSFALPPPPPPPPPPPCSTSRNVSTPPSSISTPPATPPPPPPPPFMVSKKQNAYIPSAPPPPPPPKINQSVAIPDSPLYCPPKKCPNPPPLPPSKVPKPPTVIPSPPLISSNQANSHGCVQSSGLRAPGAPAPPLPSGGRGKPLVSVRGRGVLGANGTPKKTSLKPLHWVKVTKAMQGSLWADSLKQETQSRAPDIDISELESLFSTSVASDGTSLDKSGSRRGSNVNKPEIVHLVDMNRSKNCEIMLTKIKMPLQDMLSAVLALDTSVLDIDQVENLIKFCPTKEEMVMLKNYSGNMEMLGKCEQFFLELMKVPRVESKLRVFAFRITFAAQVNELRANLNTINYTSREVKDSVKLRQIMQTILTLGNALNQGTARGSAVGFRLDSLLKLSDTRARNNKMTLMHYLCKLLNEKMPELLDFDKDLIHLEAAAKIQLKMVAEEMQAVNKGLEKVEQELTASETDGVVSVGFRKVLKDFLYTAEAEVRSLISLYSEVGRNADSLAQYFGEDPARCPFEQVTSILVIFVNMFNKSRDENARQAEVEKRKLEKEVSTKERPKSLKRMDADN